jgi:pimeloyl-CoA synthetase
MEDKIQNIIYLIRQSELDQTIKDILIRDLEKDGLTDFLREQIKAYCMEGLKKIDAQIINAKEDLEKPQENPA